MPDGAPSLHCNPAWQAFYNDTDGKMSKIVKNEEKGSDFHEKEIRWIFSGNVAIAKAMVLAKK